MSAVLGVDLSSFALDLVRLDEDANRAHWHRIILPPARKRSPAPAWERLLAIHDLMPAASFYDEVYFVAIEAPYGSNQGGTQAALNRVVGAVVACLPARLSTPECCWIVRPDEWKRHAGVAAKAKPTIDDLDRILGDWELHGPADLDLDGPEAQNGRDALCLAFFARETNARAVEASLAAETPLANTPTLL